MYSSPFTSLFKQAPHRVNNTVGQSVCDNHRVPSLREVINTYAETGQIIVNQHTFVDDSSDEIPPKSYDFVDAIRDSFALEDSLKRKSSKAKQKEPSPSVDTNEKPVES